MTIEDDYAMVALGLKFEHALLCLSVHIIGYSPFVQVDSHELLNLV